MKINISDIRFLTESHLKVGRLGMDGIEGMDGILGILGILGKLLRTLSSTLDFFLAA